LAAGVPVAAGLDLPNLITGSLGGLVVVLEGIQQLYRFHHNWVRYRWTTGAMEREKALWTARAGDYAESASSGTGWPCCSVGCRASRSSEPPWTARKR
jgi:hypothetical protein